MFRLMLLLSLLLGGAAGEVLTGSAPDWGFFGHRRINRLAVFTLPPELAVPLRGHIDYLTEHAVDPDKRRYATAHEAVRHYIDLDHWGSLPFADLPRDYVGALQLHSTVSTIAGSGDTTHWRYDTLIGDRVLLTSQNGTVDLLRDDYRRIWYTTLLPSLYNEGKVEIDSLTAIGFPGAASATVTDRFSKNGILPYHLEAYHRRLTDAFAARDGERLLQLAAEMGHYVGDAHVPLHTTINYNGQLTDQLGIHAFWESRLPELFADEEYDYVVGPAEYIEDPRQYYWDIVLTSHSLVDSVLNTERRLSERYPTGRQRCFEERGGKTVATQCAEYSRAWSQAMNGMVEERFRAAIHSVGSVWYSCWVDAGQPDLSALLDDSIDFGATTNPVDTLPQKIAGGRRHE
jgi:hypothetical protein